MLAPTPAIAPSPLDIGGLFSASINALKQRFGLFILIALLPSMVTLVVMGIGTALVVASAVAMAARSSSSPSPLLIVGIVVTLAGGIVGALVQVKAYGLMSLAAYEVAQSQRPNLGGLLQRSRGFLPRIASVIALGFVLAIAVAVGMGLVFVAVASRPSESSAETMWPVIAFGVVWLLTLALVPVAFVLGTKLLYTVPAVALEGLGGIAGLKRSWTLTRGAFWRTFGYYLLGSLCVGVVSYLVSMVSQVLMVPASLGVSSLDSDSDPSAFLAALAGLVPAMAIAIILQLAVSMVSWPFLQSYVTYMFIDQVRRSEMPQAPAYRYPTAPSPYAQPAQYYGQPYPNQPYPGQTPQQAPGWPGQATPPQAPGTQQYPPSQGSRFYPPSGDQQYLSQPWTRPQGSGDTPDGQSH